ncbi:MAG: ImmA/IrrE family metallo-endopeptidase [Streptococcaceae bacterium]|nr:ImmA/IrrE family metallo-endopeptidase [Streptococcaceae bacterium]
MLKKIWRLIDYVPSKRKPFPIVVFLEIVMPILDKKFTLEINEDDDMESGMLHGNTIPSTNTIQLKNTVYDNAVDGNGMDRMTIGHEIGHYLLHFDVEPQFASIVSDYSIPAYKSAEWQAKAFAGELLIPYTEARNMSVKEIMETFQVTEDAAKYQREKAKNTC